MMHQFDKTYWEDHWKSRTAPQPHEMPVNPYLVEATAELTVGTALDVGCGTGTEVRWLAEAGWQVTGADISATALATASASSAAAGLASQLEWVETDLGRWDPERTWDLVFTNYAHPDTGQLALYQRMASWVAPGGTILIVAHGPGAHHGQHNAGAHPADATATLEDMTNLFSAPDWSIDAGYEHTRTVQVGHRSLQLNDVVVRAHRRR